MSPIKRRLYFSLFLSSEMFILTISDFPVLHDSASKYVSQGILEYPAISPGKLLPHRTQTESGAFVHFSYVSGFGLLIVNLVIVILAIRSIYVCRTFVQP